MSDHLLEAEIQAHRLRNRELHGLLTLRTVSIDEVRPIDVHFWCPTQTDAAVLARELYRKGYLVTVLARDRTEEESSSWYVEAGIRIAPAMALSDTYTAEMVRLAMDHESKYGGWGMAI